GGAPSDACMSRPPAKPALEGTGATLLLRVPPTGIDPLLLGRSAAELGIDPARGIDTLRVEPPPQWRWRSTDAAFLGGLLRMLDAPDRAVAVEGIPQDLEKLLALARRQPPQPPAPATRERLV